MGPRVVEDTEGIRFFLWWRRRGKGERRFRQTGGSRTAPTVRPGDGSPRSRGHGRGFVFFCGGNEGVRASGGSGRRAVREPPLRCDREMGPRIREDTEGGVDGAEEVVEGPPWGSFAICEHLFHDRKCNRDCRLMARRSCHNGGIGSTPIPSASSGQALAFPHQRGKGFEGGEILRLRCAVLGIIWGERGGERWVPAFARTRRGSGRPQGSPLRGAGRRGVKGCFLSLGGSDLILLV